MAALARMLGLRESQVVRRFHVDPKAIALNKSDGSDRAVFTYWLGDVRIGDVRRVEFLGRVRLVYDPRHPLPNGSAVWLETTDPVRVSP